jgi:hypothetical protein
VLNYPTLDGAFPKPGISVIRGIGWRSASNGHFACPPITRPAANAWSASTGRDHYLGLHGTPETKTAYDQPIAEWLAVRHTDVVARPPAGAGSVDELILGTRNSITVTPMARPRKVAPLPLFPASAPRVRGAVLAKKAEQHGWPISYVLWESDANGLADGSKTDLDAPPAPADHESPDAGMGHGLPAVLHLHAGGPPRRLSGDGVSLKLRSLTLPARLLS